MIYFCKNSLIIYKKGNLEKFKFELRNQVEINSMCKDINKLYIFQKRLEWGRRFKKNLEDILQYFFLIILLRKISILHAFWQACLKFIIVKMKLYVEKPKRIEYVLKRNFLEKKWKTAILLYCFHTAGLLHIFALYNLWGPGTSFYRKSKMNELDWFDN